MKYILIGALGFFTFAAALTVEPQEASAAAYVVHHRGWRGPVVVRRPVAPVRRCRTVWSRGVRRTVCYR
ncbi:MAG: hypothetical protein ACR650_13840 [Methylocystis sp.]|jgi:hypothetical protein